MTTINDEAVQTNISEMEDGSKSVLSSQKIGEIQLNMTLSNNN